jgi:hypothetical protein
MTESYALSAQVYFDIYIFYFKIFKYLQYPVDLLTRLLGFDNDADTRAYALAYGIRTMPDDDSIILLARQKFLVPETDLPVKRCAWIDRKRADYSLAQVFINLI